MKPEEAARCLVELTAAFPSVKLPTPTIAVWRQWLEALPFPEAKRAISLVCAQHDFPTVHQMVSACGISSEQVLAMLVAAKDGGFELVRDPNAPHGWRTSREELPAPAPVGVACPPEVKERMREALTKISNRTVPAVDLERNGADRYVLEAELAAVNARFNAELARAEAAQRGDGVEVEVEDLLPY